jgi:hypothetical protein
LDFRAAVKVNGPLIVEGVGDVAESVGIGTGLERTVGAREKTANVEKRVAACIFNAAVRA